MFAPSASSRQISSAERGPLPTARRLHFSSRTTLTVGRIGHLVPATSFDGIVHSVFAHACNIAFNGGLLTVVASELADGPAVWRLAGNAAPDFRHLFALGERLRHRHAAAATRTVVLDLSGAECWRPPPPPAVSRERLAANLRLATVALEHRRRLRSSVVDRGAIKALGSLEDACRQLDIERATAEIHRLVGWGEGLTPAGDDAIVGALAALGALAGAGADRCGFLRSLCAAIDARTARTTVISAHYLRLATQGHFNADVTRLTHALIGDDVSENDGGVRAALEAALSVGATSGADMATGMIAGFRAWGPRNQ